MKTFLREESINRNGEHDDLHSYQINPETQVLCAGRQGVISSETFGQLVVTSGKFRDYRFHHFPD